MPRARSRPCEPAGSPFPFPHFPTARPYFFLYPAVLPAMPHATFPASFCPAGRQGQRRFLCRLHGRRSSALPFRPIGGAPGTAPLFLHPAARHRMPRTVAPSIQTAKTTPLPFPMLPGDGRAHANRRAVPSISTLFRAHPALPGGGHARLIPPVPARGCSCSRLLPPHLSFDFRPALLSAPPTPVRASLPRRFLRFRAALFPAAARCIRPCSCAGGRIAPFFRLFPRAPGLCARRAHPVRPACVHRVETGEAVKPSAARSCTPGPVPARADASRRSFAFSHARRAPFLPSAPCAPACASRRDGGSCKASCCTLLHARPALKQRARNRRPASASPRARPVRPPRTPGTSVPPRTPGASVPLLAAVRFGSHSAVQSLPIFFRRPAGKRTRKANLIRTYVRIRF